VEEHKDGWKCVSVDKIHVQVSAVGIVHVHFLESGILLSLVNGHDRKCSRSPSHLDIPFAQTVDRCLREWVYLTGAPFYVEAE